MANIPKNRLGTYVEKNAGGPGIMGVGVGVEDAVKAYSI